MLYEPSTNVRVQVSVEEPDLSETDNLLIRALSDFAPLTALKNGDLCVVKKLRKDLRVRFRGSGIPMFWKVQFVASRAQLELYKGTLAAGRAGLIGLEDLTEDINSSVFNGFSTEESWLRSYVYAHGFPHGMHPNTASWFEEGALQRVMLEVPDMDWEPVLDEFHTQFRGYELPDFTHVSMDLAPDLYALGLNLERPLLHEEETFHAGALLGLEEDMATPAEVDQLPELDPEHDIYRNH